MTTARSIDTFKAALASAGTDSALAFLNDGVAHRYSAVYRLEGDVLRNILLHDKAGEVRPAYLAEVPFETSFCQFVIRDGQFQTSDSAEDRRLDGHPYQGVMVSYHGVPIMAEGEVWGTLCHFDVAVQPLTDHEFQLLRGAAAVTPGFVTRG
jgi:GAF domain-containing protein